MATAYHPFPLGISPACQAQSELSLFLPVLVWILPEAEPETRTQMQVV